MKILRKLKEILIQKRYSCNIHIIKDTIKVFSVILFSMLIQNSYGQDKLNYNRERWLAIAEKSKPHLSEKIIKPIAIVDIIADSSAFQDWCAKPVAQIDSIYNTSFKNLNTVTVDFGDHYTGYFSFELKTIAGTADAPVRFRLTFGEVPAEMVTPFDPFPGALSRAWMQDEVITVMDIPAKVTMERRFAFRYVKIELLGSSPYFDFNILNMQVRAVTSARVEPEPLQSNTSLMIKKIDRVGQKTLSECMQTVYEDGPKRDRRLWVADMYLEALANSYSFKNLELTKRCLYLLAGLSDSAGYIPGTVFETPEPHAQAGQHLMDYALLYNVALKDYLEATKDLETADDLWPVAKQQLTIIEKYLQADGLVDFKKASNDWWIFIEWKEGLHKQTAIQGVMIYALKQTYELATRLNREHELKHIPALIDKMTRASLKYLYNKKSALFESGPERQVSYASQVWMVLADVLSVTESQKALRTVVNYAGVLYPSGPYMYHFFIQALINTGMTEMARQALIDYWGGMVNKNADTFWEVYDPQNDFLSPYNFYPLNSYCHAWSCTPVYFIRKYPEIFQK
jgi:alpha-L-rhamnosidase